MTNLLFSAIIDLLIFEHFFNLNPKFLRIEAVIDIDITLIIQIINFLVTLWIVNILIISPIRENLYKRRYMMDIDLKQSERLRNSAEKRLHERENILIEVREKISCDKRTLKENGEIKAGEILNKSNEQAVLIRNESAEQVRAQSQAALKVLEKQVPKFSKEALAKILG